MTGLKKYFCNQVFEDALFLYMIPPQISTYYFHFHVIYFLHTKHFHCNWYFLSQKSFNLNVHALVVVPFATAALVCRKISIIRFNIIIKVGFPRDTIYIKKTKEWIYSDKIVYWSLEKANISLTASKPVRADALK